MQETILAVIGVSAPFIACAVVAVVFSKRAERRYNLRPMWMGEKTFYCTRNRLVAGFWQPIGKGGI